MSTGINTCQQKFYALSANAPKYSDKQCEPYSKTIVITSVGSATSTMSTDSNNCNRKATSSQKHNINTVNNPQQASTHVNRGFIHVLFGSENHVNNVNRQQQLQQS